MIEPGPVSLPRVRALTSRQWAEIEALWESGEVAYADLIARYGKCQSTYERHFKKRGLVKGVKAGLIKKKVEETLAENAALEAGVLAARIKETKEQHYKMAAGLATLTWAEILKTKQDGTPVAIALSNLKALDTAMNVLKKAREERYSVLGMDRPDAVDPDELPELVISELTADQVQELRERDHHDLDDLAVMDWRPDGQHDDDAVSDDEGSDEGEEDEEVEEDDVDDAVSEGGTAEGNDD